MHFTRLTQEPDTGKMTLTQTKTDLHRFHFKVTSERMKCYRGYSELIKERFTRKKLGGSRPEDTILIENPTDGVPNERCVMKRLVWVAKRQHVRINIKLTPGPGSRE